MDNLNNNFGKRKIKSKEKTTLVQEVFSNISDKYDLMNDLMSLGSHRIWKKKLVDIMNIQKNNKIVDVGSGTGDLVKLILNYKKDIKIYSVDLNKKMLKKNKENFNKLKIKNIHFINANAENLPFENNYFDKYVISFCLRNITYINKALLEAHRILKPGGIFYCLEFSMPTSNMLNFFYSKYKEKIIPYIGDKITNNKTAYRYLEESISQFPHQEILSNKINFSGFKNVKYESLFGGIVSIHIGYKI